jgi:hypothetical protein
MRLDRRQCLGAVAILALGLCGGCSGGSASPPAAQPKPDPPPPGGPPEAPPPPAADAVTPEQFGAAGDGQTNDTDAFAKMTAAVNKAGGGRVVLRKTTYVVGGHVSDPASGYAFAPANIMVFDGCTKPLTIEGNGAILRCADGLRFGTFDPKTGLATQHPMPYLEAGELASPYQAMIQVQNCTGQVTISGVELDGNAAGLNIGGPYGDTGWQIPCSGLVLKNNHGPVSVSGVKSHHHALDGGIGDGNGVPSTNELATLAGCEFSNNGRNGWSLTGAVGWSFSGCKFNNSAKDLPFDGSNPKAGIDFEAEAGKTVSNISLTDCIAENNGGAGCLMSPSKNVSNISWTNGRIVGTSNWSYYGGANEGVHFTGAVFRGALVHISKEVFQTCLFSDDVSQSPTGQLYHPGGSMFLIDDGTTHSFTQCQIEHSSAEASTNGNFNEGMFDNCQFRSKSGAGRLDVYGHFRGSSTHFIADSGGTDFQVLPAAKAPIVDAGGADDPFSVTSTAGVTTIYQPAA